jgi:hypothetical protein
MSGSGRGVPGRFPPAEIAEVKALACELPAETGRALSRWSSAELAREAVTRGIVCEVSGTTVWRWLSEDAIRPWAWRSWVFPRDPEFREKAGRVLDLYERRWERRRLHPGEYVISADEKTQLQALLRRHPLIAPGPERPGLVEHEYRRRGTLAYLAATDVHDPQRGLFGRCEAKISNDAFDALVAEVMSTEPYASARRVFWVVDNGIIHRGQKAIDRLQGRWPNLVLVHLSRHASWLNQTRVYFLDPLAQGTDALPLQRPRPTQRARPWFSGRVPPDRHADQLDLHPRQAQRPPRPARSARPTRAGRLNERA